jgi:hypothetical protein
MLSRDILGLTKTKFVKQCLGYRSSLKIHPNTLKIEDEICGETEHNTFIIYVFILFHQCEEHITHFK